MTASPKHQRLLIIDFGSQVTQLIARRVRESGVYCEVVPYDKATAALDPPPQAVILSAALNPLTSKAAPGPPTACSPWAFRCWASAMAR